jgi:hypothetical protein
MFMSLNMCGINIINLDVYVVEYVQAFFGGQGRRYYVQDYATSVAMFKEK